ncbi:MFS transporter [Actinoplanes lobatus]|uniref:MFS family permease n=1 Tax=Actinoplanes lobatus TaxID=113568 RepID=A0A7W7HJZ3_9ACTN|nr:MFS transporter [Actinoplanes lobatus]MBB4751941.1 MFS family permease [Actinoplanes lobatus]GGN85422.1 MFS transporter [Actinoplanes lobatus]GIE44332.1 MFS transporter [Actinoplanes lobatus]
MNQSRALAAVQGWARELVPDPGPARRLAVLTTVQALGFGLFLSSGAIYLSREVGLSAGRIGLGLSAAGLAGLLCTVPLGRLADRIGARPLLLVTYAALAVLFASYSVVGNFTTFVVVASLISIFETSSHPLRMTLTHALFDPGARVRVAAQMRSLFNVGFMAGAGIAGVALAVGTRPAFVAVLLLTGAAHAACAVITWRTAATTPPQPATGQQTRTRSGLRDLHFVALALLSGIIELYQPILTVALPLWILHHTHAPGWLTSVLLVLDTILVIAFQVAMSRGAETATGAARLLRRAGALLALCCAIFAFTGDLPMVPAVLALVAGTAVLVLGELGQAAGGWGLSLHLPPPGRQGEYQGVFALGRGLQQTAGPFLVTVLAIDHGRTGWLALAAVLLVAGLLCPPITAAAQRRTRVVPATPATADTLA